MQKCWSSSVAHMHWYAKKILMMFYWQFPQFGTICDLCGSIEMTVKCTRVCYWIARPSNPGKQSNNTSRVRFTVISHTSGRSRFHRIHIVSKRNWDGAWLINLTQQSYLFLKFAVCSIALLNLNLKGRGMVALRRTLSLLRRCNCSALWCHAVWTRTVLWHNAWIGYKYSLPSLNRSRAIHKHQSHNGCAILHGIKCRPFQGHSFRNL